MTTEGDAISFPEETKMTAIEMPALIDNVVSSLQSFSTDDKNQFSREINARLYKRFCDLPQGKLRTKIRSCISL